MKKCSKLVSLLTSALFAVGIIACKEPTGNEISGGETEISKVFIEVPGTTITGTETWIPESEVFESGRTITICDLIVSDHEVTQKEYETYCSYSSNNSPGGYGKGDNYPVYYVNWYDAIVYCNLRSIAENLIPVYKLGDETDPKNWTGIEGNETDGYRGPAAKNSQWNKITMDIEANGYRLPTEVEWEYLARGGKTNSTMYSGSDEINDVAYYTENSDSKTHEIKGKKPNAFGLYDMSGNIREWCSNLYNETSTIIVMFSQRGGSWYDDASKCSVAYRACGYPEARYQRNGFRVVRTASK